MSFVVACLYSFCLTCIARDLGSLSSLDIWSSIHRNSIFHYKSKSRNDLQWIHDYFKLNIWRWLFHQRVVGKKIWFFRPPMMSFAFLDMIFGGKGLQIDTYKPPKCIWSYHTHVVNTSWPKWSKRPKFTFLTNFHVKNSIKSS